MLTWLTSWTVAPWLAVFGTLAVAAPIIIHLLNKRKFKIVDWAAMEFLLDADKRNRRRVRLEDLLLLFLRCLAVFLLGLMLARPFLRPGFAASLVGDATFSHIVVLDDSLSTQVQTGNQTAFEEAKIRLVELLRGLEADTNRDTFTLILTSQPEQRLVNGTEVTKERLPEFEEQIGKLEATDKAADFGGLLTTLEQEVKTDDKSVNRLVYLITDLRKRDWTTEGRGETENDPVKAVTRISEAISGVYILDIGNEAKNLMITDVRAEDALVAGVSKTFNVQVTNYSLSDVRDVTVKFKAGESLPLERSIEVIPAGKSESVPFSFTFADSDEQGEDGQLKPLAPVRITVEVVSSNPGGESGEDRLAADSTFSFPARVVRGIPTLIVDGDPNSDEDRSESFYLKHALAPEGELLSGVSADVVHESELETVSFAKYQVIFLCNVYEFSEKVERDLKAWVERGGGLVIMPGDHVNETIYNKALFKDGQGLSPLRLDGIKGDETEETWVKFKVEVANHQVLGIFEGQNNPALEMAKVFRWWGMSPAKDQLGKTVNVLARLNDPDQSIAIAEKKLGEGRVVLFAIPADADWHAWPIFGTYLIAMQELVAYQAGDIAGSGLLRAGEPLSHTIDISEYKTDAEIRAPREKRVNVQAHEPGTQKVTSTVPGDKTTEAGKASEPPTPATTPPMTTPPMTPAATAATGAATPGQTLWQIEYDQTAQRGFYDLRLGHTDGRDETLLYAVNADPAEGDLAREDIPQLQQKLGSRVKILSAASAASLAGAGAQREIWTMVLFAVAGVLIVEQLLGWVFGWRR